MAFRLAQISDTHLSASKPYFVANFLRVADHIGATGADLVINSGDMSLDGAAEEADLIAAKHLHARLDLPLRYLAGNHDIGESQDAPRPRGLPVLSGRTRALSRPLRPGLLVLAGAGLVHPGHQRFPARQ